MSLMEQMLGIERTRNEPQLEAQLKNAIDYAIKMYGLTYVLDKGPSFISALLGGGASGDSGGISSLLPAVSALAPATKLLRVL